MKDHLSVSQASACDEVIELKITGNTKPSKEFRKVRSLSSTGKKGGGYIWPEWIQQLVLEMLVNGTPPSAIRPNIVSQVSLISPDIVIHSLPSARYIRQCRTVLRIIGETLTVYRLAKANTWQQLFTDGTSRRQVALQILIISITENNELRPLILSSAIILEGESSEQQQSAILDMIIRRGQRLQR